MTGYTGGGPPDDRVIVRDDLVALLDPFDAIGPVLDRTDPALRFAEDLIRLCRDRGLVELGVAVLVLARAHAAGEAGRALETLLDDPALVRVLETRGGRR